MSMRRKKRFQGVYLFFFLGKERLASCTIANESFLKAFSSVTLQVCNLKAESKENAVLKHSAGYSWYLSFLHINNSW